jgi:hypothetical protein
MLLLEHLDNLAEASAAAISNIKFDKIVVWENGSQNGDGTNVSNFLQGMSKTLPPMLQVMKDIGGVELPETFVRMTGEESEYSNHDTIAPVQKRVTPLADSGSADKGASAPDKESAPSAKQQSKPAQASAKRKKGNPPPAKDA